MTPPLGPDAFAWTLAWSSVALACGVFLVSAVHRQTVGLAREPTVPLDRVLVLAVRERWGGPRRPWRPVCAVSTPATAWALLRVLHAATLAGGRPAALLDWAVWGGRFASADAAPASVHDVDTVIGEPHWAPVLRAAAIAPDAESFAFADLGFSQAANSIGGALTFAAAVERLERDADLPGLRTLAAAYADPARRDALGGPIGLALWWSQVSTATLDAAPPTAWAPRPGFGAPNATPNATSDATLARLDLTPSAPRAFPTNSVFLRTGGKP